VHHPAQDVAEVAVGAQDVLRLVERTAEGMDAWSVAAFDALLSQGEHRRGRIERGDHVREDGRQQQERQDRQANDRAALAQDVAERVPPQRRLPPRGQRIDEALRDRLADRRHQVSRTRGSSLAYEMSTSRLTTMKAIATRTAKPWMIW
jgi:hypothetical protein